MYCEHCGLQILPKKPVCTHCGTTPTQQLFQLMSLASLLAAVISNALIGWFLLPRMVALHPARPMFRIWLWVDQKASLYGWVPLAMALLAWDYFVWRKERPKIKGWLTRKLLTFVLVAGIAPIIPWWLPAGQPPERILTAISSRPGLPVLVSWGAIVAVIAILCWRSETRDLLLGRGVVLSLVSLCALLLLLSATLLSWTLM